MPEKNSDFTTPDVAGFYFPSLNRTYCKRCLETYLEFALKVRDSGVITHQDVENGKVAFCYVCNKQIR